MQMSVKVLTASYLSIPDLVHNMQTKLHIFIKDAVLKKSHKLL